MLLLVGASADYWWIKLSPDDAQAFGQQLIPLDTMVPTKKLRVLERKHVGDCWKLKWSTES